MTKYMTKHGENSQSRIKGMSSQSDRLTSFLHKIYNEYRYCAVAKLSGNKFNKSKILISLSLSFFTESSFLLSHHFSPVIIF